MSHPPAAKRPDTSQGEHIESKPSSPSAATPLPISCGKPSCCGGYAHRHASPATAPNSGSCGTTTSTQGSASHKPSKNHRTPPLPTSSGAARRPSFLREFLANPIATAAIAPSSRHLAAAMLKGLDMASLRTIVEFGPGTGVFTRATIESLRAAGNTQARFIALELNPRMAANLQAEFAILGEPSAAAAGSGSPESSARPSAPSSAAHAAPAAHPRVTILNDNALNIDRALASANATHADLIVSGLGWPSIPAAIRDAILEKTAASLAPGQEFRTFGYHIGLTLPGAWGFRKTVRRLFKSVTISPVIWRNLPPAFVYRCVK